MTVKINNLRLFGHVARLSTICPSVGRSVCLLCAFHRITHGVVQRKRLPSFWFSWTRRGDEIPIQSVVWDVK